jgi:acyl-CoA reductase-like NAD-dependent aldehyde dehydrogenase
VAEGGRTYANVSPWTGQVIGQAADASASDVDEAIAAARRAFDETDRSTNHAKRLELVTKLYELFCANTDRQIQLARDEAGSTIFIARNVTAPKPRMAAARSHLSSRRRRPCRRRRPILVRQAHRPSRVGSDLRRFLRIAGGWL